jgi:hypothetical protein
LEFFLLEAEAPLVFEMWSLLPALPGLPVYLY